MSDVSKLEVCEGAGLGLAGAIEAIAGMAQKPEVLELNAGPYQRTVVVVDGQGRVMPPEKFSTGRMPQSVAMDSLADFVGYVWGEVGRRWGVSVDFAPEGPTGEALIPCTGAPDTLAAGDPGEGLRMEVFVGANRVVGDLLVGREEVHEVRMDLTLAPEFRVLQSLRRGVSQRELWKALTVDLRDEVSEALLLQVSQLAILNDTKATFKIDSSGLTKKSASAGISIVLGEGQAAQLQQDWKYTGRVFQCIENKFVIELRLEVEESEKEGVVFRMHLLREDRVMEEARKVVAGGLRGGLPAYVPVYLGTRTT